MVDPKILKKLYLNILRIRLVEEQIAAQYGEQEMRCPVHLCIGQEAVAAGVCANLSSSDYAVSSHRSHGHYLAKGGDLRSMLAEIYGKYTGCSLGKGGSMHLIDLDAGFLGATPIVGSTIPIGVGAAFGSVLANEERVSVIFFGEGSTEEGVFHESINFASLKELPVIFICENNLYSVYSGLSVRQPESRNICDIAKAHSIEVYQGDGNNILEVYDLAGEAIRCAREGNGPRFLEFLTYRWREHCGPNYDNDIGYRSVEEFEKWKTLCPVKNFESKLINDKILSIDEIAKHRNTILAEIKSAFEFAKTSPFPPPEELFSDVYAGQK